MTLPLVHDHPVGKGNRLKNIMGNQYHRQIKSFLISLRKLRISARRDDQGGKRFIEQQDIRLPDKRPGKGNPLLLTAGHLCRPFILKPIEAKNTDYVIQPLVPDGFSIPAAP